MYSLTRRDTPQSYQLLESLKLSGGRNGIWYEPGLDTGLYATAQQACRECAISLQKLRLTSDETWLLELAQRQGFKAVRDAIALQEAELQKSELQRSKSTLVHSTAQFAQKFCDFATRWSSVVELLLPKSPEFSVSYGLLNLLFSSVIQKREKQEKLSAFIDEMVVSLPVAEFYADVFPTTSMKACMASVYVRMTASLLSAVSYYRNSSLAKLADILGQSQKYRFDEYTRSLQLEIARLKDLRDAAHVAQSADMKDTVDSIGIVMAKLYALQESRTAEMRISLDYVQKEVGSLQSDMRAWQDFQLTLRAQELVNILLGTGTILSATGDMNVAKAKADLLSARDEWENNGILDYLSDWTDLDDPTLLWICGQSGSRGSWVSSLSVDIIQALQPEEYVVVYALCNDLPNDEKLTPITLVKALLAQICADHPTTLIHNPGLFNTRFDQYGTNFCEVWSMLEAVVVQLTFSGTAVVLVVDRIEEISSEQSADVLTDLLPRLTALAACHPLLRVLVTSIHELPDHLSDDLQIVSVCIDTEIRAKDRTR